MKYMLDTNICIYAMKNKCESLSIKLSETVSEGICISVVTHSELEYGVYASAYPQKKQKGLD